MKLKGIKMKQKSTLHLSVVLAGLLLVLFATPVYASHGRNHNHHAREHRHHHGQQHEQEYFFGFSGPSGPSCCNSMPGRNHSCGGKNRVWIDGYWDWYRGGFIWVEGFWTRRPARGHWKHKKHCRVWVPAHWSKH